MTRPQRIGATLLPTLAAVAAGWALFAHGCRGGSTPPGGDSGSAATPVAHGDFSRFEAIGWIDTHVHLESHRRIDAYVAYADRFGMDRIVLQSLPLAASLTEGRRPNRNAEGLLAKLRYPGRFYVFGGLDLTPILAGEPALMADLQAQVDEMAAAGMDGIKLYFRGSIVEPLAAMGFSYLPDNPSFAPFFAAIAAHDLPILIHIDEPYFSSGTAAFALYPDLTWIVTHMAWAGTDVARLETILDAGDSTYIDVGHFLHLGESLPAAAALTSLLETRPGRIFAGSDFGSGCDLRGKSDDECPGESAAVDQAWTLRAMLELEQAADFTSVYTGNAMSVPGLHLPRTVLEDVYREGPLGVLGAPRPVSCPDALVLVDRSLSHTSDPDDLARLNELRAEMVAACP